MNLFGLNLSLNRNSKTEIRKSGDEVPISDAALRWLRGEDVPQRPCLANAYEQVVWVYPVIWTDVLQPYTTSAAAGKAIAVFGALKFWWFGEHGHPRMDTSIHVFFQNDQLAVRFIEEIDFDYCAADATAALLTAAS